MFIILMGVSGSGKTTIGEMLSDRLGWHFYEGDQFHPPANIAKMSAGIPLTDEDRAGWLAALRDMIQANLQRHENGILACSALKEKYRQELQVDPSQVKFIYLRGTYDEILARMQARKDHYMKPSMLKSQFDALEEPKDVFAVDIALTPEEIVEKILAYLRSLDAIQPSTTNG